MDNIKMYVACDMKYLYQYFVCMPYRYIYSTHTNRITVITPIRSLEDSPSFQFRCSYLCM